MAQNIDADLNVYQQKSRFSPELFDHNEDLKVCLRLQGMPDTVALMAKARFSI